MTPIISISDISSLSSADSSKLGSPNVAVPGIEDTGPKSPAKSPDSTDSLSSIGQRSYIDSPLLPEAENVVNIDKKEEFLAPETHGSSVTGSSGFSSPASVGGSPDETPVARGVDEELVPPPIQMFAADDSGGRHGIGKFRKGLKNLFSRKREIVEVAGIK